MKTDANTVWIDGMNALLIVVMVVFGTFSIGAFRGGNISMPDITNMGICVNGSHVGCDCQLWDSNQSRYSY